VMRKEKIEIEGVDVDLVLRELSAAFGGWTVDRTDGLKLVSADGWVHVRKSNTEPILRLLAEARTAESVQDLVRKAREVVARAGAAS